MDDILSIVSGNIVIMDQEMKERLQSHKRNTIAEIAAKAGVSAPTVSRVLNNRPDVAADTRETRGTGPEGNGFHAQAEPSFSLAKALAMSLIWSLPTWRIRIPLRSYVA